MQGIALDKIGNLYITDNGNNRIRKIDQSGIITTFAGNGVAAYSGDGGQATSAAINLPYDVTLDGAGNLYIADTYNNRVRKVNTSGVITTIAGNGVGGFTGDGGLATLAEITVMGIAFDVSYNNLYISDGTSRVRVVSNVGTTNVYQSEINVYQITIYPNPTSNNITIQSLTELGVITIYNSLGEKVKEARLHPSGYAISPQGEKTTTIDISNLPAGVYTINAQNVYKKIIKE